MPARQRVIFAYLAAHSGMGSKIMRVDQLAAAATEQIGRRWDIETLELPRMNRPRRLRQASDPMRDALVIFLKGAFARVDADLQQLWSDAARAVAIDYVDANIDQRISAPVTVHIGASRNGMAALVERLPGSSAVELVDHHWDPRLAGVGGQALDFSCGYFGHLANTVPGVGLEQAIATPGGSDFAMSEEMISEMAKTPLHFGVRATDVIASRTVFKPFTKGFNAAAVGANILVNREVDDAIHFLGDDYPFLIEGTGQKSLSAGLTAARSAFGSPVWDCALDRMRAVRDTTSIAACVTQLDRVLARMMDLPKTPIA